MVVLITGCNGNIAKFIISYLTKNGYTVIGCDKSSKPNQSLNLSKYYSCNFSSSDSLIKFTSQLKKLSPVDFPQILINNAAIDFVPQQNSGDLFNHSICDEVMKVNFSAPVYLINEFCNYWILNGVNGKVLNISSIYSKVAPNPNNYNPGFAKSVLYGASKAALNLASKQLAISFCKFGISINSLILSGIETSSQDLFFKKQYKRSIPIGRFLRVEEIFPAIDFLLSSRSTYLVGGEYVIDGGYLSV
jgi:NAD(P)-dependent dehydrogenase (short-subunit alcohol dehydrogenase family)